MNRLPNEDDAAFLKRLSGMLSPHAFTGDEMPAGDGGASSGPPPAAPKDEGAGRLSELLAKLSPQAFTGEPTPSGGGLAESPGDPSAKKAALEKMLVTIGQPQMRAVPEAPPEFNVTFGTPAMARTPAPKPSGMGDVKASDYIQSDTVPDRTPGNAFDPRGPKLRRIRGQE